MNKSKWAHHAKPNREYSSQYYTVEIVDKKTKEVTLQRIFILTALTGKKNPQEFSSPFAAKKAGWVKL